MFLLEIIYVRMMHYATFTFIRLQAVTWRERSERILSDNDGLIRCKCQTQV